jgi:hypothetical protein
VLTVSKEPKPWVQLAPFDVWVAQELGALPAGAPAGAVPPDYEAAAKELADATGDGRVGFSPVAGEPREKGDDDEEDGDDEDEEEDEDDAAEDDEEEDTAVPDGEEIDKKSVDES